MSQSLPFQETCCQTCDNPVVTNVPGAVGAAGAAGAAGAPGVNASTVMAVASTIPAYLSNTTITVGDSTWMSIGQIIFIQGAGYFQVVNKPSTTSVEIMNPQPAFGSEVYGYNLIPGTAIVIGATVTAAGMQGPSGVSGLSPLSGDITGVIGANQIAALTADGDLVTKNAAIATVALPAGANKTVLHVDTTSDPKLAYKAIDLTGSNTSITGALPVASGGTGAATAASAAANILVPAAVGDIWYASSMAPATVSKLTVGSAGQVLTVAGGVPTWSTFTAGNAPLIVICERAANGVSGYAIGAGINIRYNFYELIDTGGLCTVSTGSPGVAGYFTLATGTYRIEARIVASITSAGLNNAYIKHRSFLTTSDTGLYSGLVADGTSEHISSYGGSTSQSNSLIQGRFVVSSAAQKYYIATYAVIVSGLAYAGLPVSLSGSSYEYYSMIRLEKE